MMKGSKMIRIGGYLGLLFALVVTTELRAQRVPKALRDDIKISHYMAIGPDAVRLLIDPISKSFYYTTFSGDIIRVAEDFAGNRYLVREYTAADHGITRLQGASFLDSTLFLVGNISVNRGKGTKGIMMKGKLNKNGRRDWTLGFITEDVGSTKTIFDHGFNGTVISPDGKYIFVN